MWREDDRNLMIECLLEDDGQLKITDTINLAMEISNFYDKKRTK